MLYVIETDPNIYVYINYRKIWKTYFWFDKQNTNTTSYTQIVVFRKLPRAAGYVNMGKIIHLVNVLVESAFLYYTDSVIIHAYWD